YYSGNSSWTVKVVVKNTGSADATISTVMINGIPADSSGKWTSSSKIYYVNGTANWPSNGASIPVGSTVTFTITLASGNKIGSTTLSSGITLNIVLHSAAGKDYPASVTLP
ncbi:MAG: hypothetical protein HA495_03210, partial [Thaumarchaeota archaeon]|nr:hypothetical protein [Nitrososphaerota archaeon]